VRDTQLKVLKKLARTLTSFEKTFCTRNLPDWWRPNQAHGFSLRIAGAEMKLHFKREDDGICQNQCS
jgi:hypothetical protein